MEKEELSEETIHVQTVIDNAVTEIANYLLGLGELDKSDSHLLPALASEIGENFKLKLIQKVL